MSFNKHPLLVVFSTIFLLFFVDTIVSIIFNGNHAIRLLVIVAVIISLIIIKHRLDLRDKIIAQVFKQWGFQKVKDLSFINELLIAKFFSAFKPQRLQATSAWQGKIKDINTTVVYFEVTIGQGKSSRQYDYVGVKIPVSNNISLHILDQTSPIRSGLPNQVQMESNEFNRKFQIYSNQPVDAFYKLPPDIMHNLMEFRNKLSAEINIEFNRDYIFIFADNKKYNNILLKSLSIAEASKQIVNPEDIALYQQTLTEMIEVMNGIYNIIHDQEIKKQKIASITN